MTDLSGFWLCDDGGYYYIVQSDDIVMWVGMSNDQAGRPGAMPWGLQNGLSFCNVFSGKISRTTLTGQWADVPRGTANNFGELTFSLTSADGNFLRQFEAVSETGGFGGTKWVQLPGFPVLPLPWFDVVSAFKQISKNITYWDWGDAQYERESLWRNLDVGKDAIALFGTLKGPIETNFPYNLQPIWEEFWEENDNDYDANLDLIVDLEQLPLGFYNGMQDASLVQKKIGDHIHCELVMFARHNEKNPTLRVGWAEMNGDSVLLNGRPLNGNLEVDRTGTVTSIGYWSPPPGAALRVSGVVAFDHGHDEEGDERGLEIHPVYAVDIITAVGTDDLTGAWGTKDGGTCYIRHLRDNTIWFFWVPPFGNLSYATVFRGNLDGDTITGVWFDVPVGGFGARQSSGTLSLTVLPGKKQLIPTDEEGGFSDQLWTKLYETELCAFNETANSGGMMDSMQGIRLFRDKELLRNLRGREYVRALEENGLEIISRTRTDKQIRKQGERLLGEIVTLVGSLKMPTPLRVPAEVIRLVESLMDDLAKKASPRLKKAIENFRPDLRAFESKTLLEGLKAVAKRKARRRLQR